MDRTVRIQLHPKPEQAHALLETLRQFTQAFNAVCRYGWQHDEKNGVKLHHGTYYETKASCPGLVSDLLIQARVKATEALKSAFTWKAKRETAYPRQVAKAMKRGKPAPSFKPVKMPQSCLCPVRYNEKTFSLNWQSQEIRLSTSQGKIGLSFTIPPWSTKYQGYPVATADLLYRKGKWWAHVVVQMPEPQRARSEEVIGIDLGLTRPAVTSTRRFLGSKHWKEVERRRFRLKRKLQSKGTKSGKDISSSCLASNDDSAGTQTISSPNSSFSMPPQAAPSSLRTSPTLERPPTWGAVNRTRTSRTSGSCIIGRLPNCIALPPTKRRNEVAG
jgi:putative transposase